MDMTDMNAVPQRTDALAMPAPQAGAQPAPASAPGNPDTSQMQQASPEEQQQKDRFVARAMQLIYNGGKVNPAIADMLDGGSGDGAQGDPAEGLGQATAMVVGRIAGAAEKSGVQLTPDVVFAAGTEIFEDLAHASKALGIKDYSQDKQAFQRAYFKALDTYHSMLQGAGEIDQQSAQADMQKMQQMDQAGQLDPLFRKLASDDEQGEPTADGETGEGEGASPAPAPAPRRGLMG